MARNRRFVPLMGRALLLAASLAAAGCAASGRHLPPREAPPPPSPPAERIELPPPLPPPPSESDLAIESAREAESRGDHRTAVEQYRKAAGLTLEEARLADIEYLLAMILADPNNAVRNLEEARFELQRFMDTPGERQGRREARVVAALIDELAQVRAESAALKAELETFRGQVAELKAKLEEKEKELSGIKKVLLQNKKKP